MGDQLEDNTVLKNNSSAQERGLCDIVFHTVCSHHTVMSLLLHTYHQIHK